MTRTRLGFRLINRRKTKTVRLSESARTLQGLIEDLFFLHYIDHEQIRALISHKLPARLPRELVETVKKNVTID